MCAPTPPTAPLYAKWRGSFHTDRHPLTGMSRSTRSFNPPSPPSERCFLLQMHINFEYTQAHEIAACRDAPWRVSANNRGKISFFRKFFISLFLDLKNIFTKIVNMWKYFVFLPRYRNDDMTIQFDKKYLSELYYTGKCSDKKHRFQPKVIRNYVKRIITLADAPNVEALYVLNSLNYEVLSGDKAGISSIRIDLKYRLEFKVEKEEEPVITVCNILDITNHYK